MALRRGSPPARAVHVLFLHPALDLCGTTERLLAAVRATMARGDRATVLARPGVRAPAFEQAGVPIAAWELPERPWRAPFACARTRDRCRALKPDLLHVTDERLASFAAQLSEVLRVPRIQEVCAPLVRPLPRQDTHLSAVVVPCRTCVENAVNRGRAPRERVRVLAHGPDPLPWRPPERDQELRRVIGAAGRLDREHGTAVLLEALGRLVRSGQEVHGLILGEGPEEDTLRGLARRDGLATRVTLAAPRIADLAPAFGEIDLFVSPVLAGGPDWLTVLAWASGIPTVLSSVSSAFLLVEDKRTGTIVERGNPGRLAQELNVLLGNPEAAHRYGCAARARYVEEGRPAAFREELTELHHEAVRAPAL